MYCPNRTCPDYEMNGRHGEYREGITECPYCGERLVADDPSQAARRGALESQPPPPGTSDEREARRVDHDHGELEPVFETADPTEVPIVRSFLDSEGIPHVVVGEERFDAFRGALSPFRFNPRAGVVAFLVPSAYADLTRELLAELEEIDGPDS